MSIASKSYLKSRFQRGDIPTEADFASLIDASYNDIAPNAGVVTIPTMQENATEIKMGTVTITYHSDVNNLGIVETKVIPESDWMTISPDITNYVFINAVDGEWSLGTDITLLDWLTTIPYMIVIRRNNSTHMHKQLITLKSYGDIETHTQRVFNTTRYAREEGALLNLAVSGSYPDQLITLDGGIVWSGNNPVTIPAITANTEQYVCIKASDGNWYYYDFNEPKLDPRWYTNECVFGAGLSAEGIALDTTIVGWPYRINAINDTDWTLYGASVGFQEGDIFQCTTALAITGADTLTTFLCPVATTMYGMLWVARGIESEDHIYTFYDSNFSTMDEARADSRIPELPPLVDAHALLTGRICFVGQGDDNNCQSAFNINFQGARALTRHNALSDRNQADCHSQYALTAEGVLTGDYVVGTNTITIVGGLITQIV